MKLIIVALIISLCASASAKARKGFHEGPYIRIIGGLISSKFDDNVRTGEKVANDYEGTFGAEFGWDLWDSTGPELQLRYATKRVRNSREHVVNINTNIKYTFVTNALTDLGNLHILPFVQGGPAAILAAVPGDRLANNDLLFVWGLGAGLGVGIDFLVARYAYFGILIQGDVHHLTSAYQNIGGVRSKIIAGGWEPQLGIVGMAGVHF
jgi:hypothetical protein